MRSKWVNVPQKYTCITVSISFLFFSSSFCVFPELHEFSYGDEKFAHNDSYSYLLFISILALEKDVCTQRRNNQPGNNNGKKKFLFFANQE